MSKKIGIIIGSLRKGSFSRITAYAMRELFPDSYDVDFIDIDGLEVYNQDFEGEKEVPENYVKFRSKARACDGFLFVTPEHNRSVPAALKNALDIGSRPYGHSVWDGKVALIASVSMGNISGFGANHHLRQSLVFLNVLALQQPEVYLGNIQEFIEDGKISNKDTIGFLQSAVDEFVRLIEKVQ